METFRIVEIPSERLQERVEEIKYLDGYAGVKRRPQLSREISCVAFELLMRAQDG